MSSIRPPVAAGTFYPETPSALNREMEEICAQAEVRQLHGVIKGMICPHAGYVYSGRTAAEGYQLLKGASYDAVIVVGPSHREYFNGISVFPGDGFRTPLGDVGIHQAVRSELVDESKGIALGEVGHRNEHSIEVQLPLLQKMLGTFLFVPVVMGDQHRLHCSALADQLTKVAEKHNVLLVASSDLSHYYDYDTAVALDRKVIDCVEQFDADRLQDLFERNEAEACGGGPMVSVMWAAKKLGANRSEVLYYCNSGDVTGQKDRVVGYLSAALLQVN